ncbi:hypothetical protein PLANPX_1291 [Lacipirellula parvula]|uniref:Uncharacterized protein n=2 Tax=Lacipirellula parvula TaxID=2650471 RepID=A0A5K7XFB2_9BACT|nr:hypothetical protein PLANPX_1291 [Lacipirellula parvula]
MPEVIGDFHANLPMSGLNPTAMVEANGLAYFAAKSGTTTNALWKSDGTVAGTMLVRDLYSGNSIESLTNVGGRLFFVSDQTLWTSDGTAEGTQSLGVNLRTLTSGTSDAYLMTNVGGTLYFNGYDALHGSELWRSDGTVAGTSMVADLNPNQASGNPTEIVDVGGIAYFAASDAAGRGLWKTNGSLAGTSLVVGKTAGVNNVLNLTSSGQHVYFAAHSGAMYRLWRSGAEINGAELVVPASGMGAFTYTGGLTNVNGSIYFVGNETATLDEIWRIDGSSNEASLLKDIHANSPFALPLRRPGILTNVGGTLYFTAGDAAQQLWKSDGTEAGTVPIAQSGIIEDRRIIGVGDRLFYRSGTALWTSDGTAAGTISLGHRNPKLLTAVGSSVMFSSVGSSGAAELWQSDGTLTGTAEIGYRTLALPYYGPSLVTFHELGYFSKGNSLWRTDGTAAGTYSAFEINPGSTTQIRSLVEVGDALYIGAANGNDEYQLWKSDGTPAGTELVHSIHEVGAGLNASEFYNVDGTLVFVHAIAGPIVALPNYRLWSSDGTEAGTFVMRGLPNYRNYGGSQVLLQGKKLYLLLPSEAEQLWQTDGTQAGTMPVRQALGVPAGVQLGIPVQTGDSLVFPANDGVHGWEPWRKVGANLPYLLADINPGPSNGLSYSVSSFSVKFYVAGETFYFGANDGAHGSEPWRSDGTHAGTYMLRDVYPGSTSSSPTQFVPGEEVVYFRTFESDQRKGMWTSDGTLLGTRRVEPYGFSRLTGAERSFVFDGMLYFTATDVAHGLELWRSDGVSSMEFLGDLAVGDSFARGFTEIDGKLLFFATNDQTGIQLYAIRTEADGGDYDGNGIVDGGDFLSWQRQFGSTATPAGSGADGDEDGVVGAGDLDLWRANFGLKAPLPATNQSDEKFAAAASPALPSVNVETAAIIFADLEEVRPTESSAANATIGERAESIRGASSWADRNMRPLDVAPHIHQKDEDDRRSLWLKRNQIATTAAKRVALLNLAFADPARDVAPIRPPVKIVAAASFDDLDDRSSSAIALEETEFWRE